MPEHIMISQCLLTISAAIVLLTGTLHLHGTFFGSDLRPSDPLLEARMRQVSLNVSGDTTMWKAWIGFNAILSFGLILFGVVYGYLAMFRFPVLQESGLLVSAGALFLSSLALLWKHYTFWLPSLVFTAALALFLAGASMAWV